MTYGNETQYRINRFSCLNDRADMHIEVLLCPWRKIEHGICSYLSAQHSDSAIKRNNHLSTPWRVQYVCWESVDVNSEGSRIRRSNTPFYASSSQNILPNGPKSWLWTQHQGDSNWHLYEGQISRRSYLTVFITHSEVLRTASPRRHGKSKFSRFNTYVVN